MKYVNVILYPFAFIWSTLFGARPVEIDARQIINVEPVRLLPSPIGSIVRTEAWLYREPVSLVRRDGYPDTFYSKKKVHVLGVIDRHERAIGETVEGKVVEVVKERREIVPGVWAKPKDVLEIRKTIDC